MKQYILSAICAICSICVLFSCTDDDLVKKGDKVVEGIPTKVKLSFTAATPIQVETKSALPTEEEFRVTDLYLFVFNAGTGEIELGKLFTGTELGIQTDETGKTTGGQITVELSSGEKRIYAIANVPNESSISELTTRLDGITNVEELLNTEASLIQETYLRSSGRLLMTGVYGGALTDGRCTIDPAGTVALDPIKLKRVDARITFTIGIEGGGTEKKFVPKKWQVFNLPKRISLLPKGSDLPLPEGSDLSSFYFNMSRPESFETTTTDGRSSFTFYMWESRKSTENLEKYQQRELQDKTTPYPEHEGYVKNGAFVNAPANSAYVVLTGEYYEKYTEEVVEDGVTKSVTKERTADVTYTIHLGYVGDDVNDFKTERNTTYKYNVNIKNVNDIRLEVTSFKGGGPEEPSPGAEGNIVETDKFYQLDAHFEYDIIVFNRTAIEGKAGFKLKTPFDEGYFSIDRSVVGSRPVSEAKDYEWVHFRRHEKNAYGVYSKGNYQQYKKEGLLDIEGLLKDLKEGDPYDENGEAVYTMFVDEYYYDKDPRNDNTDPLLWKQFVNQPNREMHILCNTDYSQDRESSLTTSSIMISQRSIKTFYNEQAEGLSEAWGIETINETGKLTPPDANPWNKKNERGETGLTMHNGRWNFFEQTGVSDMTDDDERKKWSNYISMRVVTGEYQNHLREGLDRGSKLVWACLQRNRDEDGNGTIDNEEVKWYPASITQYKDIWIGKDALPVEAHLYPNGSNEYWRYLSSNGEEFYAEEGSANGPYKFHYLTSLGSGVPTPSPDKMQHDYRCVRNLGMSNEKPESATDGVPQDYVSSHDNGRFYYPFINKNALRGKQNIQRGEFAMHTELDPLNRPYVNGFEYKETEYNMTRESWKAINDKVSAGNSPCAKYNVNGITGWRLPNERELSLMTSRLEDGWPLPDPKSDQSSDRYPYQWARTASSLAGKRNCGYGGWYKLMSIPADYYIGRVRCVRDIE